ncbi:hypothetical protein LPJ53_004471 [Coemansia erecta]|uniref:C2H2-type domain-containing protein n=1 Tax=Coemansia erecta TaxID=147472 RepID=A0A9W7XYZ5_9FUNG|nr:hypothetical protein LPJ53_004471 [Coemansia erecta]
MPNTSLPGFSQTPSTQVLSPMMEDPLPGFSHPAQVFRTPENRMLPDISAQVTPVLALFDDADAIGGMRVLSPRTQTAQAGLSLLAASATYAQSSSSNMLGVSNAPLSAGAASVVSMGGSRSPLVDDRGMMVVETPFLNARGENATLMSQPQNSLTNHFSPPMVDRMSLQQQQQPLMNGMGQSMTTGRLVRNRSLLRQSSGLTSATHGSVDSQASDATSITIDDEEMHSSGEMSGSKRRRTDGEGKTRHKRDQERRFDCDVCHRSFARQYNLKTHRLTHFPNAQASRPFKCAFCPKAFTRKHDLQRHSVLHERKDKHTCVTCNRGFPRKDALKKHIETENCCPPV